MEFFYALFDIYKERWMKNLIRKILKEEYGRDYRIESLYDVIKDELLNIPSGFITNPRYTPEKIQKLFGTANPTIIDDFKMMMSGPIGGVENFMLPHTKHELGHTRGLVLTPEGKVDVQGPHGMLAMAIVPKLKEMGIIGGLNTENEVRVLDKIATLFYNDIKPQHSNDSDMFGRNLSDIENPD